MAVIVDAESRKCIMNVLFWYLLEMKTDVVLNMESTILTVADVRLEIDGFGAFKFHYEEYQPFGVFAAMQILAVDVRPLGQAMSMLWLRGVEILKMLPPDILTEIAIQFIDTCLGDTGSDWKEKLNPLDITSAVEDALRVKAMRAYFN